MPKHITENDIKAKEDNMKTPEDRAQIWKTRFTKAEQDQRPLFKKVSERYDIMYAVQNTTNIAPWRAKIYVPILASKAWDLIARLSGVLPYFRTQIMDELIITEDGNIELPKKIRDRQKRIDAKLHYDYAYNQDEPMKLKVFDTMLDAVVAGTGFAKGSWKYETKKVMNRQYTIDGLVDDMSKEKVKTIKAGKNDFEPVNFFNVFVSNQTSSYNKSKWVIIRYFKPIDELKANDAFSNVDKLHNTPEKGTFDQDNQSRNRLVNENTADIVDETVPTATIFEVYEKTPEGMKCGTYGVGKDGKGWVELEKPYKKYWHDYFPVQPFYIRRKSFSPWGESLFENNASLQYATNDLFNHYLDNWNLSIDSMIMYEDGTLTSDFVIEPGGEITYTGEKPDAFKFPEPNPAQLSMVMNVVDKALENATLPQYLSGVPNSATDKTMGTAKGITSISEAANEKVGYMRDNFKQSMSIIGQMWVSNLKQFMDKAEEVRTFEKGRESGEIIIPQDFEGDILITIDDDSLMPMSKDEKRESIQGLTTQAMMIQKAAVEQANILGTKDFIPIVNYQEILDESVQYYAIKDPMRFIVGKEEIQESQPEPDTASLGEMVGGKKPEQNEGGLGDNAGLEQAQGNEGAAFGGYAQ